MRAIEYLAPSTIDEAVALLVRHRGRARILAGGTDLIVQVREGVRDWDVFVDAKKIPALGEIAFAHAGALTLGAAVPCHRIYADVQIRAGYPALADAAALIGGIAIRGRASVGGNLCNAGPAADSIPALIAHRATCVIAGPNGPRTLAVESFCLSPGRNALEPDEMLVSLVFPAPVRRSGAAYVRFIPREEMDIAVVGVGASVVVASDTIVDAQIALGAVAPTPIVVTQVDAALRGGRADDESFERAAALAREQCRPISDMRGTAEHRRHLVGVLVKRALRLAVDRARRMET